MTNKTWQKWSKEEKELLKYHWEHSSMETLLKTFPNRKYNSLIAMASILQIKSKNHRGRVNGNLHKLKDKTKEIFHLWGFIMADGCFTTKYDLAISQKSTERKYLTQIIKTLGCDINKIKTRTRKTPYSDNLEMCYFRIGHTKIIKELYELIGLKIAKTYNPPTKFEYFLVPELLIFFVIGLIEGDGCIWISGLSGPNSWPNIRVEMHYNWLPILETISKKLFEFYGLESYTKTSNRGYAQLNITKKQAIKKLLDASKSVNRMESKWLKLETINYN